MISDSWNENLEIELEEKSRKLEQEWLCNEELPVVVHRLLSNVESCLRMVTPCAVASTAAEYPKADPAGITKIAVAVNALPADYPSLDRITNIGQTDPGSADSTKTDNAPTTLAVTVANNDSIKGFLTVNGPFVVKGEITVKSGVVGRSQQVKYSVNSENNLPLPQLMLVKRRLTGIQQQLTRLTTREMARFRYLPAMQRLADSVVEELTKARRDITDPPGGFQFPLLVVDPENWVPALKEDMLLHIHVTRHALVTVLSVLTPCTNDAPGPALAKVAFNSVLAPGSLPSSPNDAAPSGQALISPQSSAHSSSTNLVGETGLALDSSRGRTASHPIPHSGPSMITGKSFSSSSLDINHTRSISSTNIKPQDAVHPIIGSKFPALKPKPSSKVVQYNGRMHYVTEQITVESSTAKFALILTALRNVEAIARELQSKIEPFVC